MLTLRKRLLFQQGFFSPNPAANRIMVQGFGSTPVRWNIVNALGERLGQGESFGQSVFTIDVSQITSGLYFLIAYTADGSRSTARFLVTH